MKILALINPLESDEGTGMARAAAGLAAVLPEGSVVAVRLNRWFRRVNRLPFSAFRQAVRLLLAQVAPFFVRRDAMMVFSSHHGPLWRTGRHTLMVYDLIALNFPGQSRSQAWYYRRILPRALRCASRVVTISEAVQRELAERFPGTPAATATVIPSHVVRLERPCVPGLPLAERRARGELAFVGARYAHKNLGLLLTALAQPAAAGLRVTITGCQRDLWPDLPAAEAAGRAKVLERASDHDLDRLYEDSLALVYPSLAEGLGLPPLEAMRSECPVVCADIPVLRETCGDAAFYVHPRDAAALATLLGRMKAGKLDAAIAQRVAAGSERSAAFGAEAIRRRWTQFAGELP